MPRPPRSKVRTDAGWQAMDMLNLLIAFLFIAALILLWPGQFNLGQKAETTVARETVAVITPAPRPQEQTTVAAPEADTRAVLPPSQQNESPDDSKTPNEPPSFAGEPAPTANTGKQQASSAPATGVPPAPTNQPVPPIVKSDRDFSSAPPTAKPVTSDGAAQQQEQEQEQPASAPILADARLPGKARPAAAESPDCTALNRGINLPVGSGGVELSAAARSRLRSIARCIRLLDGRYEIGGHTDYLGDPLENLLLSVERAQAAADALIEMGVQQDRLAVKGFGQTQPIADNFTTKGRARNRRITVIRRNG